MKYQAMENISTDDLLKIFERLCLQQYDALENFRTMEFNRRYDKLTAIENELKSRPGDQRRRLSVFFAHPNSQVRLTAARATLALVPAEARRVIEDIARSQRNPQAGDAGMALELLDSGFYTPS